MRRQRQSRRWQPEMAVNRTALGLGLLFVAPLLVFLALSFRSDPRRIDSPLVGKQAPGFELVDLDGHAVRLGDLRGKPVVLNFWATWCQPCIVEHPVLIDGARRYDGRVEFIGVVYQDEPELIRRFLATRGAWGRSVVDPGGEVAIAYGVYGAPETFFIDGEGTIQEKITGPVNPGLLDSLLIPMVTASPKG